MAELCGADGHPQRRCHGRPPHLRLSGRHQGCNLRGRHDCRLGAASLRGAGEDIQGCALGQVAENPDICFLPRYVAIDGGPGFVIAFGNFEGTFYRYVKLMEAQENWKAPNINPIHKAQK